MPHNRPVPVTVRTITIRAPTDTVWAVLADLERQPEWMRDLKSVRVLSEGPTGLGTRAAGTVRMFGMAVDDPVVIDAFEPRRHFGLRHLGVFRGRGDIWLEPLPGGRATRVTWREELRADPTALGQGGRLARVSRGLEPLFDLALAPVFEVVFRADLRRLRDLVGRR